MAHPTVSAGRLFLGDNYGSATANTQVVDGDFRINYGPSGTSTGDVFASEIHQII